MFSPFDLNEIIFTWETCVEPSISSVSLKILYVILVNVFFNVIKQTVNISFDTFHVLSIIFGNLLLYLTLTELNLLYFVLFVLTSYSLLYIMFMLPLGRLSAYLISVVIVAYLLSCEFLHPNQQYWLESRGLFMVAAMKIISLAVDFQNGAVRFPSMIAFLGYNCFPANSIFGPWFSYKEYLALKQTYNKISFKWALTLVYTTALSLFFLSISNCWGPHFISVANIRWVLAYRQAFCFRMSHYFISYLSEAAMIGTGCKYPGQGMRYPIAKPLDVELPSSLVSVVISWNIPMHRFLKQYVYKSCLEFGQFNAIITTYLVSALLHGFNLEIAWILLTIGLFSYVQLNFQFKASERYNACLNVRPCKHCNHMYKTDHFLVKSALFLFSVITVIDLIYLGMLMNEVGEQKSIHILAKWQNLGFLSHILMLTMYILYILM